MPGSKKSTKRRNQRVAALATVAMLLTHASGSRTVHITTALGYSVSSSGMRPLQGESVTAAYPSRRALRFSLMMVVSNALRIGHWERMLIQDLIFEGGPRVT
jgi:hypothetical protein